MWNLRRKGKREASERPDLQLVADSGSSAESRVATSITQLALRQVLAATNLEDARLLLGSHNDFSNVDLSDQVLTIRGMAFNQDVDLSSLKAERSLVLQDCDLNCEIDFTQAELKGLSLVGCRLKEWQGSPKSINGDLDLNRDSETGKPFQTSDGISLRDTDIIGGLWCEGARISAGSTGNAINADDINVSRRILFTDGFDATGEVRLSGSCETLNCRGGHFSSKGSETIALNARGLTVRSDILLGEGFRSSGEVSLQDVKIDNGQLEVRGGRFIALGKGKALNGVNMTINGGVSFDSSLEGGVRVPFFAEGEISFEGSSISGDIAIVGGSIKSPGSVALSLRGVKNVRRLGIKELTSERHREVSGGFHKTIRRAKEFVNRFAKVVKSPLASLRGSVSQKSIQGELDLREARVEVFEDDQTSWPTKGNLRIDGFHYDRLTFAEKRGAGAKRHRWLKLQGPVEVRKPDAWTRAELALKRYGHHFQARRVGRTKATLEMRQGLGPSLRRLSLQPIGQLFFWAFAGHGYYPFRTLNWAVVIVVMGWFIYDFAEEFNQFRPAEEEALIYGEAKKNEPEKKPKPEKSTETGLRHLPPELPKGYEAVNPLAYSLDVFFIVFQLHQESYWIPRGRGEEVDLWILPEKNESEKNKEVTSLTEEEISSAEKKIKNVTDRRTKEAEKIEAYLQTWSITPTKIVTWCASVESPTVSFSRLVEFVRGIAQKQPAVGNNWAENAPPEEGGAGESGDDSNGKAAVEIGFWMKGAKSVETATVAVLQFAMDVGGFKLWFWFQKIMGVLLTGTFVVGVTGLIQRDSRES